MKIQSNIKKVHKEVAYERLNLINWFMTRRKEGVVSKRYYTLWLRKAGVCLPPDQIY